MPHNFDILARFKKQLCALIRYTILRTTPTIKTLQFLYIWEVINSFAFKTQRCLAITSKLAQSSKLKYPSLQLFCVRDLFFSVHLQPFLKRTCQEKSRNMYFVLNRI